MAGQGGGSDGGRATQIDFGGGIAHAAGEIAVHGRESALTRSQDAEVATDAGSATGSTNRGTGGNKDFEVAQTHRFQIDLTGGRDHNHANIGMELLATQDIGGDLQIVEAAIGAGAQKDLINLHVFNFANWLHNIYIWGAGHRGS